jgi:hypothetical protein
MDVDKFEIQIVLENEYGEFKGKIASVTEEQYLNILNMSKSFYSRGFELTCEDGTFVVFPPEIVNKSILKVKKIIKKDVQE